MRIEVLEVEGHYFIYDINDDWTDEECRPEVNRTSFPAI
jgi:hypothetical protein